MLELWAGDREASEEIAVDEVIDHREIACVQAGDTISGSLPVTLRPRCARLAAGTIFASRWSCRRSFPGKELTVADMRACWVRMEEFRITR
jgi:putative CRISPR-associated protein (TIGR02620 family)